MTLRIRCQWASLIVLGNIKRNERIWRKGARV